MPADSGPPDRLLDFLNRETARPAPQAIVDAAKTLVAPHGPAVIGVIFYGSCRRTGDYASGIVDLYLLVESYRAAYRNPLTAIANRLLPPNVAYAEVPTGGGTVRFKYGIVSLAEFERRASAHVLHPAIWGRFAQPVTILLSRDTESKARIVRALAEAQRTLIGATVPLLPARFSAHELWTRALAESYGTEFRAEGTETAERLYRADAPFYDTLAQCLLTQAQDMPGLFHNPSTGEAARERATRLWRQRRRIGKPLSLARLVKAAFTFRGGADYLLWKIERHSGVTVPASPWQRRHPLLSGPLLAWRLYRRGGFR